MTNSHRETYSTWHHILKCFSIAGGGGREGERVIFSNGSHPCAVTSSLSSSNLDPLSYHRLTRHLIFFLNKKRPPNYKADCTLMTSFFKQFHAAASLIGTKKCYNLLFVLYVFPCHPPFLHISLCSASLPCFILLPNPKKKDGTQQGLLLLLVCLYWNSCIL